MPVSRISCSTFISTNSGASWWIDEYLRDRNEGEGKGREEEGERKKEKRRKTEGRGGRRREEVGHREIRREVRRRRTVVNVELSSHNDC